MDIIQTEQDVEVKILYNWLNCPFRECCPGREKRERNLIMHLCSFNPSIFKCEIYQKFNSQTGIPKIMDLKYL